MEVWGGQKLTMDVNILLWEGGESPLLGPQECPGRRSWLSADRPWNRQGVFFVFFGRQLIPRKPGILLVENDYLHIAENSPKWEPLLSSVELVKLIHWQ